MRKNRQISLDSDNSGIGRVKFGLFGYRYKGPDAQRWPAPKNDGLCDLPTYQGGQICATLEDTFLVRNSFPPCYLIKCRNRSQIQK